MDSQTLEFYNDNAAILAEKYNSCLGGISDFFPKVFTKGQKILDVACGSGRDLIRLLEMGCDAYGVDACQKLLDEAQKAFPQLKDRLSHSLLPNLDSVADNAYDGIVCSAVLMHLPKEDLFNAVFSLRRILRKNGSLLVSIPEKDLSLRDNNRDKNGRLFNGLTAEELQLALERLGFHLVEKTSTADALGRETRTWTTQYFRLRNSDGSRSLDKIEAVLNRDKKVATYKPALFRALSEIAQTNYNAATWHHGGIVSLPLREISLKWILYYWPIVESETFIPQIQAEHKGARPLAFRALLADLIDSYKKIGGLSAFVTDLKAKRLSITSQKIYAKLITKLDTTIKDGPIKYSGGFGTDQKIFEYQSASKEIVMPADL